MQVMASCDIDRSALIHRITAADPERRMPFLGEPLDARGAALISHWSGQGAQYEPHRPFIPPVTAGTAKEQDDTWPKNPIDWLSLDRLEGKGLRPSGVAAWRGRPRRAWMPKA